MQFIIFIVVVLIIIELLGKLFNWVGSVVSSLWHGYEYLAFTFVTALDKLIGQWWFSPTVSWAISGLFLGSLVYFVVYEARKLSRPMVSSLLLSSCFIFLFISPIIGPKTAHRPEISMPKNQSLILAERLVGSWSGKIGNENAEFTIHQNGAYLNGDVVYGRIQELFEGIMYGEKITLIGKSWQRLEGGSRSFSLDTFDGGLTSDGMRLSGSYKDKAGHTGSWYAVKNMGNASPSVVTAPPPEPVRRYSAASTNSKPDNSPAAIVTRMLNTPERKNRGNELRYGIMLLLGKTIEKNSEKGIRLIRQSAEHGSVKAQKYLGALYYKGDKVKQDYSEAAKYYRMAAASGLPEAQHFYGMMLAKGIGVDKNTNEAMGWIRKAADQGFEDSKRVLAKIGQN